ncbi:MAG: hypothetical protein IOC49_11075 [Methylobacterium sp.]|nr:hypothetical protein [Methylobacterium sp.]
MNAIDRSLFLLLIAFFSINRHPLDRKNAHCSLEGFPGPGTGEARSALFGSPACRKTRQPTKKAETAGLEPSFFARYINAMLKKAGAQSVAGEEFLKMGVDRKRRPGLYHRHRRRGFAAHR